MLLDNAIKSFFEESATAESKTISHPQPVYAFHVNEKRNHLWVGDAENKIYSYDLDSLDESHDLKTLKKVRLNLNKDEHVHALSSNESGTLLTTSNNSNVTRLIAFRPDEPSQHSEKKLPFKVVAVALMEDSRTGQSIQLASGMARNISAIDCFTNKEFRTFVGHLGAVVRLKALQGCQFLSSATDKSVKLWDVRMKDAVRSFCMDDNAGTTAPVMAVDSTGNCLTLGSSTSKSLHSFDLSSGRLVSRNTSSGFTKGLQFAPNERVLMVSTPDGVNLANMTQIPAGFKSKPLYQIPSSHPGIKLHPVLSWTRTDRNVMVALDCTSKQLYTFLLG